MLPVRPGARVGEASCARGQAKALGGPRSGGARRRSGPLDLAAGKPLVRRRGKSETPSAENPLQLRRKRVVMVSGYGHRPEEGLCTPEPQPDTPPGIHCWAALVGGRFCAPVLAAQSSVPVERGEKEPQVAKTRTPQPSESTCAPALASPREFPESLLGPVSKSHAFCSARRVALQSQFVKDQINILEHTGRQWEKPAHEAVKVLTVQFSLCLSASSSRVSDADVHWGLYREMEGGREGFNLLYASESAALIVPLRRSCHLLSPSFLTTFLGSNESKANGHRALASVNTKHGSRQCKLNRLPSVLQVAG
ncbi:hypothetical protein H920_17974 [Fukomys damarensis]|uniref:Uncharacterized protein n=1 Tax=Fukomys damarensis TaxID=885580 RepID=A0A091DCX3_FUKDA|nr:hypothetical protein H920_17974 [Fukomys damarensis]